MGQMVRSKVLVIVGSQRPLHIRRRFKLESVLPSPRNYSTMSRTTIRVRYDGPALANHSIDVDEIASALQAISQLFKLTNGKFNQDRAAITVLVNVNIEQHCFEFGIELLQELVSQVASLDNDEGIATPAEMLIWLGLAAASFSTYGLLELLKRVKGRSIESSGQSHNEGNNDIEVSIKGDNNVVHQTINVFPQTDELARDQAIEKQLKRLIKPLSKEGYEKLQIESDSGRREEITKEEAQEILNSDISSQLEVEEEEIRIETMRITVYSPVYEEDAPRWRFRLPNSGHVFVDIGNTNIAENAVSRGGALVNDSYKVILEMKKKPGALGALANDYTYKILEVLDFRPAELASQSDAFD